MDTAVARCAQLSPLLSSIVPANLRPAISRPELCPVATGQATKKFNQIPEPGSISISCVTVASVQSGGPQIICQ